MAMQMTEATLQSGGNILALTTATGESLRFHAVWLRDNAQEDWARDPGNGQKLTTLADLPEDCRLSDATLEGNSVCVTFAADERKARFDGDWLAAHAYDRAQPREAGRLPEGAEAWDSALNDDLPSS
ncbi:MAG: gamma-butyrobetaine dioxygenase, partial [Rhodobacteraceae bacterium]|nr:gamma-butyrobetaine dioxygenase [Paracoccaceae bacterium]